MPSESNMTGKRPVEPGSDAEFVLGSIDGRHFAGLAGIAAKAVLSLFVDEVTRWGQEHLYVTAMVQRASEFGGGRIYEDEYAEYHGPVAEVAEDALVFVDGERVPWDAIVQVKL